MASPLLGIPQRLAILLHSSSVRPVGWGYGVRGASECFGRSRWENSDGGGVGWEVPWSPASKRPQALVETGEPPFPFVPEHLYPLHTTGTGGEGKGPSPSGILVDTRGARKGRWGFFRGNSPSPFLPSRQLQRQREDRPRCLVPQLWPLLAPASSRPYI